MKLQLFKTVMYHVYIFLFAYSMLYLIWTGATYIFIGGETITPNEVGVVTLALLAWYMTRDFFNNVHSRKVKK